MNLYSTATSIYCHRTRIVLAEKDIAHESIIVDSKNLPEDLIDLNPYSSLPTLVDRDLVLYNSRVIMEYLEERFPHPPLMPVGPVARAQTRLALFRVEHDWYPLAEIIETKGEKAVVKARKELMELSERARRQPAAPTVAICRVHRDYYCSYSWHTLWAL